MRRRTFLGSMVDSAVSANNKFFGMIVVEFK